MTGVSTMRPGRSPETFMITLFKPVDLFFRDDDGIPRLLGKVTLEVDGGYCFQPNGEKRVEVAFVQRTVMPRRQPSVAMMSVREERDLYCFMDDDNGVLQVRTRSVSGGMMMGFTTLGRLEDDNMISFIRERMLAQPA